jgi:aspartate aminotransferase-like enzyme
MEASIRCARPGRVLSIVNGAFSERYAHIARACGRQVDLVEVRWGDVVSPDVVEQRLGSASYAAVTVVHSETSTGALTNVHAVAELAHRHGAQVLVDSVSGVGGAPLEADAWGLDFALTGSQKALALPPGLAFGVASREYMRYVSDAAARGVYFDLLEFEQCVAKNQTPNTPAISLLYALDVQLGAIAAEGLDQRWMRHAAMARATAEWAYAAGERLGVDLEILAPAGARSPTVSALVLPDGVRGDDVVAEVARRGYTIGGGYGKLRDRTVRIGHMGDHTVSGVRDCLAACESALERVLTGKTPL